MDKLLGIIVVVVCACCTVLLLLVSILVAYAIEIRTTLTGMERTVSAMAEFVKYTRYRDELAKEFGEDEARKILQDISEIMR